MPKKDRERKIHLTLIEFRQKLDQHEKELAATVKTLELVTTTIELQSKAIEKLSAKLP